MSCLLVIAGVNKDFRVDYSNLLVLCASFPNVPVVAMTATATNSDREAIKRSLDIKDCCEIVGNPDQTNITYEKHVRVGSDVDSLLSILTSHGTRPTSGSCVLSFDNYIYIYIFP